MSPFERIVWSGEVPARPDAVGAARRDAHRALVDAGIDTDLDPFDIVLSELLTNAVVHGAPPIEVTVSVTDDRVRAAVRDGSPDLPTRVPADGRLRGNGLRIAGALAERWGVAPSRTTGKTVWFQVRRSSGAF